MSLLEDIFLRDEADEARELERIIEGDEYDDQPRVRSDSDDNSEKEDEAEEEKKRVDPSSTKTKRTVKNPRFILNPARLTGPRGIQVIPEHFKDFKFKGKGHEKEDLDLVLKKLEHWAYRLYPRFEFKDCLKKIEVLGKKRPVMVHLQKIRSDQYMSEETVVQKDSSDDEALPVEREEDEFDKLLQQQIELARNTPAPSSVKKTILEDSVADRSLSTAPKATSSPSISEEQRERMLRNRKLAEERRLARLKKNTETNITTNENTISNVIVESSNVDEINVSKKHNTPNTIDSLDEDDLISMNESIAVDIHEAGDKNSDAIPKINEENSKNDDFNNIINKTDVSNENLNELNKDTEVKDIEELNNGKGIINTSNSNEQANQLDLNMEIEECIENNS